MQLKDTFDLEPGMILAQDVLNNYDTVVLSAGTELTTGLIMNLQTLNVDFVFISSDETQDLSRGKESAGLSYEGDVKDSVRKAKFDAAVDYYKHMYQSVQKGDFIRQTEVFEVVKALVQEFYQYDDIFSVLKKLKSDEDYEYKHSTSMCIISVLLAKWLKVSHQKIYVLAQAAYLADIGKALLPNTILGKTEALTAEEQKMIQSHVVITQELLEKSEGFTGEVIHIAASHHERLNGTGYPYSMEKETINQLSRIVAVADTYHALLSKRPYREAYSICEATEMLWSMSYNELDPKVTERLVKFITSFWVGGQVVLSNGMTGEVVMANQYDRFRPLVKVGSQFIDLSKDRSCKIVDIVNSAV